MTAAAALAALLVAGWCVASAHADDPLPLPALPTEVTPTPDAHQAPSGRSQVGRPAPARTMTVSPPSQQQIDDARDALERLRKGTGTPAPLVEVAAADKSPSVSSRLEDQPWWTIGAGLLVLLVASEATRVSARRAKHRKEA